MTADEIPSLSGTPRAATNAPADRPGKTRGNPSPRSRRIRLVELLLEVSRRMAAYDSLDEVLYALVDMTTREVGAERGSLFLNDPDTNELYSRVAQGNIRREIRLLNTAGIVGAALAADAARADAPR